MIFWDLDDTVADFAGAVTEITGNCYKIGDTISMKDWGVVRSDAPRIFRDLEFIHETRELILKLSEDGFDQAFLTALPEDGFHTWQWASMDKVNWVNKHFGDIPIFFGPYAHQKKYHAKPGYLLIDDKQSNISEWDSAGGIGHLYRDPISCKNFLEDSIPWMKFR